MESKGYPNGGKFHLMEKRLTKFFVMLFGSLAVGFSIGFYLMSKGGTSALIGIVLLCVTFVVSLIGSFAYLFAPAAKERHVRAFGKSYTGVVIDCEESKIIINRNYPVYNVKMKVEETGEIVFGEVCVLPENAPKPGERVLFKREGKEWCNEIAPVPSGYWDPGPQPEFKFKVTRRL